MNSSLLENVNKLLFELRAKHISNQKQKRVGLCVTI